MSIFVLYVAIIDTGSNLFLFKKWKIIQTPSISSNAV